jgi:hypothetical protein
MLEIINIIENMSEIDPTVLIYGNSGVGKSILAKKIHLNSPKKNGNFIEINCGAIPSNLLESELFGYIKGAFTGANAEGKVGLFEAAHNGTLFLDEIAELPFALQAKLLRVLETCEVRRLGSNVDRKMDFRLIAATNKNLKKMVDEGLFIMPLGFKLPFKPEDFLSDKAVKYAASEETKTFIQDIVTIIKSLKESGIEDSIVLGFDIYLESVKKASNSDILAAITTIDAADATFAKVTNAKFSNDPNAQIFNMSDQEFRAIWKYTHAELLTWCKENISDFKQGTIFNKIKKKIKDDINCVYTRRLDSKNTKSASQDFYTDLAFEKIKEEYESLSET